MEFEIGMIGSIVQFIDLAMAAVVILLVWYGLKLALKMISSFGGGHGHH